MTQKLRAEESVLLPDRQTIGKLINEAIEFLDREEKRSPWTKSVNQLQLANLRLNIASTLSQYMTMITIDAANAQRQIDALARNEKETPKDAIGFKG